MQGLQSIMIALSLRAKPHSTYSCALRFSPNSHCNLKADLLDAVTESGISCVRIVDRTCNEDQDPM